MVKSQVDRCQVSMKSQYCHLGVSSTTESGSFVVGKVSYTAGRGSSYKIDRKVMP